MIAPCWDEYRITLALFKDEKDTMEELFISFKTMVKEMNLEDFEKYVRKGDI